MGQKGKRDWIPNPKGPEPLPPDLKRTRTVSSRFTDDELALLDRKRGMMKRGEYLRWLAMDRPAAPLPPVVPEINREAWRKLAALHGTLQSIASSYGGGPKIEDLRELLSEVRNQLVSIGKTK